MEETLKELLAISNEIVSILKSIDNKLTEPTKAPAEDAKAIKTKKLPKYKDPVFMAELRRSIIEDHNKKIRAKQQKNAK